MADIRNTYDDVIARELSIPMVIGNTLSPEII